MYFWNMPKNYFVCGSTICGVTRLKTGRDTKKQRDSLHSLEIRQ